MAKNDINKSSCECENDCSCENENAEVIENIEENEKQTCSCENEKAQAESYLNLAKQIQADFDNFRKRSIEENKQARINGQVSVMEAFLPCLDTFKEAKKSITDEGVLKGVEMIENKINETLKTLGLEKIETIGQVYNPHLHNVIAVMKDQTKDNDIILDEYQAGYKFNDKVIRYAKVIVNKKEEN